MKKIARVLFYSIGRLVISNKWYGLIAWFYSKVIEEITAEGKTVRFTKKLNDGKIVILVLSAHAFRGGIEYLAASRELRILQIPNFWQYQLFHMLFPSERTCCLCQFKLTRYIDCNDPCFKYKKRHYEFLRGFLPKLYKRIGVDCVISPHIRYVQDLDWGAVSKEIGVYYVLINRDSRFTASSCLAKEMTETFRDLVRFEGNHLVVQSESDKQFCIDSGFVKPEQISALGCMRMDYYIEALQGAQPIENKRKRILFFPFLLRYVFEEVDMFMFFKDVHMALVHMAIKYPEIDIIIKPKSKDHPLWYKSFSKALEESKINEQDISNLLILPNANACELLLGADVVCGLNTSALLEAAIAEKPVIIPYFKELQNAKYDERIFFRDAFDMFDIAESIEMFESMICERLYNSKVDSNVIAKRKAYFERHFSSLKCDSIKKHVDLIRHIVAEGPYNNVAR